MADQNTIEQAVLSGSAQVASPKTVLSPEQILHQVLSYKAGSDASLAKIQQNIEKVQEQLNQLTKMRLMVLGQRELITDMMNKITGTPAETQQEGGSNATA